MRIGLKLWSTNGQYIAPAQELFRKKVFDYIELFTEPGSFRRHGAQWKDMGIPFNLHAPHFMQGLNFSLPDNLNKNKFFCEDVQRYLDLLQPDYVIFHPGVLGSAQDTVRQVNLLKIDFPDVFKKALIENKPKIGLNREKCVGASLEEIKGIIQQTQIGFCLDFGHAICYAAAEGRDYQEVIKSFMKLSPPIVHLSDGLTASFTDSHMHLGEGDFNLKWLVGIIPQQVSVTIETVKKSKADLNDFEIDVMTLRKIWNEIN